MENLNEAQKAVVAKITPPAAGRTMVEATGSTTHWAWRDTGIRRKDRWTPRLLVGFEMRGPAFDRPRDGGDYPAGQWVDTHPTGKTKLQWD